MNNGTLTGADGQVLGDIEGRWQLGHYVIQALVDGLERGLAVLDFLFDLNQPPVGVRIVLCPAVHAIHVCTEAGEAEDAVLGIRLLPACPDACGVIGVKRQGDIAAESRSEADGFQPWCVFLYRGSATSC